MKRRLWMAACLAATQVHAADVPALLHWSQRVELSTPVSGVVRAVNVVAGERVRKGQVLLQLDDTAYAGRAEEAAAAVTRRQEEEAEAKRDLARVQELYDRTVISTSELEQAKLRHDKAVALVKEARARYKQGAKNRADTQLRAPFDALVLVRQAEPGQPVAAGLQPQTLLVLAKAGEMVVRAQVPEAQLNGLNPGQEVGVAVGKQHFQGKIAALGLEPAEHDKSGAALYLLDVLIPTAGAVLRAGGQATINLP